MIISHAAVLHEHALTYQPLGSLLLWQGNGALVLVTVEELGESWSCTVQNVLSTLVLKSCFKCLGAIVLNNYFHCRFVLSFYITNVVFVSLLSVI